MMETFTNWLVSLVKSIFTALFDFFGDVFVSIADAVLSAVAAVIAAIPAPDFLVSNSLQSLLNMFPDYVLYFLGALRIPEALAVIGAGFAFRMVRKAVTLFQW